MSRRARYTFLACSERSGSNLITRVMDSHSACCGPSPTHLYRYLLDFRSRYGDLANPDPWHRMVEDAVRLFDSKLGNWRARVTAIELHANVRDRGVAGIASYIYEKELRLSGKRALFIKENHLWRHMGFFRAAYPEARFVFFVRDPRDMALSWKRAPNLRGCTLRAARVWQSDQAGTLRQLRDPATAERTTIVRYEDLLAAPEPTLRSLCGFLGLEYEPGMTALDRNASAVADASALKEWENLKRPLLAGNAGKFRAALSEDEIAFIETHCREEMVALGYTPLTERAGDAARLAERLAPLEIHEKPAYREQPAADRRRQERRAAVVARIAARPVVRDDRPEAPKPSASPV